MCPTDRLTYAQAEVCIKQIPQHIYNSNKLEILHTLVIKKWF